MLQEDCGAAERDLGEGGGSGRVAEEYAVEKLTREFEDLVGRVYEGYKFGSRLT